MLTRLLLYYLGTYQVKRALSYAEERSSTTDLNGTTDYPVYTCSKFPNIIRIPTRSAHVNRKTYNPIVRYAPEEVLDWWCDCPAGNRYVGCCSHIASAVWFLSFQRWQTKARRMRSGEFIELFTDAAAQPEPFESSTDTGSDSDESSDKSSDANDNMDDWSLAHNRILFFLHCLYVWQIYCTSNFFFKKVLWTLSSVFRSLYSMQRGEF